MVSNTACCSHQTCSNYRSTDKIRANRVLHLSSAHKSLHRSPLAQTSWTSSSKTGCNDPRTSPVNSCTFLVRHLCSCHCWLDCYLIWGSSLDCYLIWVSSLECCFWEMRVLVHHRHSPAAQTLLVAACITTDKGRCMPKAPIHRSHVLL